MNKLVIASFLISFLQLLFATDSTKDLLIKVKVNVQTDDPWIYELNQQGIFSHTKDIARLPVTDKSNPLFRVYPQLQKVLPYIPLGTFPTPIQKLEKLGKLVSHSALYIKRDDLTGAYKNDEYSYGGNKVRKLEFLLAEALVYGAQSVITFGCAGSNHALATAVYARRLGLTPQCMLVAQPNAYGVQNNLLMHALNNTELYYYADRAMRKIGTIVHWLDYKNKKGTYPYIIPTGGSSPRGALGFVNAAFEVKEQIQQGGMPEPDYMYVPCGSMGTTVGLILGCKLAGLKSKVVAVTIEPEVEPGEFKKGIKKLFDETSSLLYTLDSTIPLLSFNDEDLIINYDFCGTDYALFTKEGIDAQTMLKATENILLDGTYTGKAFAALVNDLSTMLQNKIVLFWDTYCGLDFSKQLSAVKYTELPCCFQEYFEQPVQSLDHKL